LFDDVFRLPLRYFTLQAWPALERVFCLFDVVVSPAAALLHPTGLAGYGKGLLFIRCCCFARRYAAEASDFLLRGQEKVTKEKAALAALNP